MPIEQSGRIATAAGVVLVTQGRTGYKLVEGKPTLFRLFMMARDVSEVRRISIRRLMDATFVLPDHIDVARSAWIDARSDPDPSIGFVVDGGLFTHAGAYQFDIEIELLAGRTLVFSLTAQNLLQFEKTHDLRFLVAMEADPAKPAPSAVWYEDLEAAFLRVSRLLPVRQGVLSTLRDGVVGRVACLEGLRFSIGPACSGGVEQSRVQCLESQMATINSGLLDDHADAGILYRMRDGTEATSPRAHIVSGNLRVAVVRGGRFRRGNSWVNLTAALLVNSVARLFGRHASSDPFLPDDMDAFDFIGFRRVPSGVGDILFLNDGDRSSGAWLGVGRAQLSVDDWNLLVDPALWTMIGPGDNPTGANEQGEQNRIACFAPRFLVSGLPGNQPELADLQPTGEDAAPIPFGVPAIARTFWTNILKGFAGGPIIVGPPPPGGPPIGLGAPPTALMQPCALAPVSCDCAAIKPHDVERAKGDALQVAMGPTPTFVEGAADFAWAWPIR